MRDILFEITPLSSNDCFYVVDRHKNEFNYPIHHHREMELNFVCGAKGAQRIVGDSVETIGDYDLVLIGSENLEHCWNQGTCKNTDIREITIQFRSDLFPEDLLSKTQFDSIRKMLKKAVYGLSFPLEAIMKIYSALDTLQDVKDGFEKYLCILHILYVLSTCDGKVLSSISFAKFVEDSESRRVQKVKEYINNYYSRVLSTEEIASHVGMSASAFSRFFKLRTGKTLVDYIVDIRIGVAARALVDSSQTVSEVCYNCGFNNISNFNRAFKMRKGMTPSEFRSLYKKHKVIV